MALSSHKGKGKAISQNELSDSESGSEETYSSAASSDSDSDSEDEITPEYLEALLQKARLSAAAAQLKLHDAGSQEEEIINLGSSVQESLPALDPGKLPPAYIELGKSRRDGPSLIRDPDVERAVLASSSYDVPAPPAPPPELTKSGKPLTKKEKKALKNMTAGSDWFDLPAPAEADLPRLYREVEALRLRNQLDPKRFYRKDEGEGKGIKGLPKYFAIGTIVASSTPFGTASSDNLVRAHRKRTLVDELVDDAEAKRYAKKKFTELQGVRGAKGRGTLAARNALKRRKW
ncbi:Fcf2-domain-containing protein [Athelia psychrophila]|uniref:Fcf2-domain-containing protein n=1 Tax=Athelia psychrophila TaxID=1759441 RepID=A0A166W989_9AGAM|nr:Fcf2-domain-containing protein [Fibularhizoctonia sp. CBS 109695]